MNILGIDTSGREGSLALRCDGRCTDERALAKTGRRHAQTLVAEIDSLVRESGLDFTDLDGVAVSIGPGSFTGLRVGVTCAKTLAWATGCHVAAVDTLRVIAQRAPDDVDNIHVISDAQRGELFVGRYVRGEDGLFVRVGEIEISAAAKWCDQRTPDCVVTGPGLEKYADGFASSVRLLESEQRLPSASIVARFGEQQICVEETADLWSLEPLYLRRSAAEEKRDG
ncbi:MAG: tRNA (adenosine(37)-N6)-threonylcarbamoyltransferase complex dimerization subunit type 1 TsaB [Planctomycetaceae bacterium]|jgi:tRNA threonylcarbamoyladenosine biosynthesis protein TsaB|nr:tRNA (adenosine(37)-N6)-threonylcarbamoyltransferase complex dimerization subunit type 1 TsaB [Planctomycetaceae bacterium]MBT6487209.1 tRNA (adenosine(37)-N6)-threonylcarbamoyltransferase complex dimerization subunit type 1 TsaB [Planctomycetaceae bacterium]MBT6498031.1 tRNA (adenosine(37)-N6)-threonylcarbamoyltransferase complex dimerization subunit type 1 TsaB [Planctomycetaceae bacterium]